MLKWRKLLETLSRFGLDNIIAFAPSKVIQRFHSLEIYKEKTSNELYPLNKRWKCKGYRCA